MSNPDNIDLRDIHDDDLARFFEFQCDNAANHMAAFVAEDPGDRSAFDGHWERIRGDDTVTLRTILANGRVAGHVASFLRGHEREVTYWIGREFWGMGVATAALRLFLLVDRERPLHARVAQDNVGSIRVLSKCGFMLVGEDVGFANARKAEVREFLLRLG